MKPGWQHIQIRRWASWWRISRKDLKIDFRKKRFKKRTEAILNMPERQLFFVANDRSEVVGVCRIIKTEIHNELQAIYVLPKYQRKGIGMMLWKESKKLLGDTNCTVVNVATYNTQVTNFYKKLGFIETGRYFIEEHFRMPISGVAIPEMELILKSGK